MAMSVFLCYNVSAEGNTRFLICHHRPVAYWNRVFPQQEQRQTNGRRACDSGGRMLEPENEMGVVVLFGHTCEAHGWTVERIGAQFPDATIKNIDSGETHRAEFEYYASNFRAHHHDPYQCDLIICWVDDYPDSTLPILSLQNWEGFVMRKVTNLEREVMHLRIENSRLKFALNQKNKPACIIPSEKPSKKNAARNPLKPPSGDGWRIEINGNYFNWRRGGGKTKEARYGGRLELLTQDMREKYQKTKHSIIVPSVAQDGEK